MGFQLRIFQPSKTPKCDTMGNNEKSYSISVSSNSPVKKESRRHSEHPHQHRIKQTLIRQAFYLVDEKYMKQRPKQFYIKSLSGDIYLIKYERFLF